MPGRDRLQAGLVSEKQSMAAILEAIGVSVRYPIVGGILQRVQGYLQAVENVSLKVGTGEVVALVGESGCGKSSLGFALSGLLSPASGRIFLLGNEINIKKAASWQPYRRQFQIIFQDAYTSLNPRHTVYEILSEPLLTQGLANRATVRHQVEELLQRVGLTPDSMGRYPNAFSGGQRQRISIARAISLEPKLIICDEIVAALDVSVQAQIVELLLQLKEEMGLALLWISHDLALVRYISDAVYVMYAGHIVEQAPTTALFARPAHHYTHALLEAIPSISGKKRAPALQGTPPSPSKPPPGCIFHTRCRAAVERCQTERPALEELPGNRQVACFFPK